MEAWKSSMPRTEKSWRSACKQKARLVSTRSDPSVFVTIMFAEVENVNANSRAGCSGLLWCEVKDGGEANILSKGKVMEKTKNKKTKKKLL